MTAQNRETKRSYIGLVTDETERSDAGDIRPGSPRPLKEYLLALLVEALKVRDVAR